MVRHATPDSVLEYLSKHDKSTVKEIADGIKFLVQDVEKVLKMLQKYNEVRCSGGEVRWSRVRPEKQGPMLLHFIRNPLASSVQPKDDLKALGELLFLIILTGWIITAIKDKDYFMNNPLTDIFGYPNVCVGFDSLPARYVAGIGWVGCAFFGLRYATVDTMRALALYQSKDPELKITRTQKNLTLISNSCYALTNCMGALLFLIPPLDLDHARAHTTVFLFVILTRLAVVSSNFTEAGPFEDRTPGQRVFMVFYTVDSLVLITFAIIDMASPQILPWWLVMSVDVMWFLCLGATGKFLPWAPPMQNYELLTEENMEAGTKDDAEAAHPLLGTKDDGETSERHRERGSLGSPSVVETATIVDPSADPAVTTSSAVELPRDSTT